ncbi:hypothetical protein KW798_04000 [Candidatus Parcubacteria bacterium]|nr:hypothetical protein [Candidatus Parcubacteria bacterium]
MLKIYLNKKGKGEELKWESISQEELAGIASTTALFGGNQTYVLSNALEALEDMLEVFQESPHTFIFEEEKLLKARRTAAEKVGAKIEEEKVEKKEWKFDNFGVATALGNKDRKKLWLALMQSFAAGEKAEAVAGLMAWKARQMRDPKLSRELTFMYHDSHRGAGDLELLLERFALKL